MSSKLSLTAQEILQSLDELDEETNLSFHTSKKSCKGNGNDDGNDNGCSTSRRMRRRSKPDSKSKNMSSTRSKSSRSSRSGMSGSSSRGSSKNMHLNVNIDNGGEEIEIQLMNGDGDGDDVVGDIEDGHCYNGNENHNNNRYANANANTPPTNAHLRLSPPTYSQSKYNHNSVGCRSNSSRNSYHQEKQQQHLQQNSKDCNIINDSNSKNISEMSSNNKGPAPVTPTRGIGAETGTDSSSNSMNNMNYLNTPLKQKTTPSSMSLSSKSFGSGATSPTISISTSTLFTSPTNTSSSTRTSISASDNNSHNRPYSYSNAATPDKNASISNTNSPSSTTSSTSFSNGNLHLLSQTSSPSSFGFLNHNDRDDEEDDDEQSIENGNNIKSRRQGDGGGEHDHIQKMLSSPLPIYDIPSDEELHCGGDDDRGQQQEQYCDNKITDGDDDEYDDEARIAIRSHQQNKSKADSLFSTAPDSPAQGKTTTVTTIGKEKNANDSVNPTGMVLNLDSAPNLYFAKEAILDPTWLDSCDEGYDDNDVNTKDDKDDKDDNNSGDPKLMKKMQPTLTLTRTRISNKEIVGLVHNSTSSTSSSSSSSHHKSNSKRNKNKTDKTSSYYSSASDTDDDHLSVNHNSVLSKTYSLASSLSVGSCGFGKLSIGGSISLASSNDFEGNDEDDGNDNGLVYAEEDDDDRSSSSELSYADIVDMGIVSSGSADKRGGNHRRGHRSRYQNGHYSDTSSESRGSTSNRSCYSQGNVLNTLYDMDRRRYYESGEDDFGGPGSDASSDDVDDCQSQPHCHPQPSNESETRENEEENKYLPSHLGLGLTPPRVKRHYSHDQKNVSKTAINNESSDSEYEEEQVDKVGTLVQPEVESNSDKNTQIIDSIPQSPSESTADNTNIVDDNSMASSASADTDVHANTSPSRPDSLDRHGLAGIIRGDSLISLLDCPGKKTRKKRENRSKIGGRKKNKVNHRLINQFNWSSYSVQHSVDMIRTMRMEESNVEEDLPYEDFCKSSISPEAIGRTLMTSQSPTKKHLYSHIAPVSDPIDTSSTHPDGNRNRHRSERLLTTTVRHLEVSMREAKSETSSTSQILASLILTFSFASLLYWYSLQTNEYEDAQSQLEQILSVFANQLDTCQRFGEDVDECNENVAATLHNIGIVQILNGKYDDAAVQFTRATDIFRNSLNKTNDLDLIVRFYSD